MSLDSGLTPNCVLESLAEPLVDPLVNAAQQQQEDELDKLSCGMSDLEDLGQSLLQGTADIVVFQREDGTLVNQVCSALLPHLILKDFIPTRICITKSWAWR